MTFLGVDVGAAINTVVSAGVGTFLASLWRDKEISKSHAGYLAMRVASTLESFTFECAVRVADNYNLETGPEERYPDWAGIPELGGYPLEVDGWRFLKREIADRALRLRNNIATSTHSIASTAEYAEDELGERIAIEICARGLEAWEIAQALRKSYKLANSDVSAWDFPDSLRRELDAAKNKLADAAKRNEEFNKTLFERTEPQA